MAKIKSKAAKLDYEVEAGSTFDITLTWKDSSGTLIDLTGYTARSQWRSEVDAATILVDLTTANAKIVLGGVAGTIRIIQTSAETEAYTFTTAVHDLEIIDSSGTVQRLFEGSIVVVPEVTR